MELCPLPLCRPILLYSNTRIINTLFFNTVVKERSEREWGKEESMVDDFMVCVDRIIASTYFESEVVVNGGSAAAHQEATTSKNEKETDFISLKTGEGTKQQQQHQQEKEECSALKKVAKEMVECRICQEEDEVHAMESPCACNGTLKFAHRKCIQRWCYKKGDITCEICNQVYSPNYSLPPIRSNPDVMAIDIRQAWGQHIDLRDSHLQALAAAEHQLLQTEYDDYAVANSSSGACLRSMALILLIVLLLRQALMLSRDSGIVQESSAFFNVSLLQFAGFILPCFVVARSWYIVHSRRRRYTYQIHL